MNSDAWRSAQRSPTQFIHNYHHSCSATEAASLPVNAPGTYWAHRQSRISPSADVQTSSGLVKCCRHETMGEEFGATRGSGRSGGGAERSCPLLRCWSWHLVPARRDSEARRAQEETDGGQRSSLPLTVCWRRIMTSADSGLFKGSLVRVGIKSLRNQSSSWRHRRSLSPPSPQPLSSPPHKMFWRSSGFSLLL